MEVVEDFESRPHKTATFPVERDKEIKMCWSSRRRKPCQDSVVVGEPGRSKAEGGKEEKDDENEVPRVEKEVMDAVLTANPVNSTTSGVLFGEVEEMCGVERSSNGVLAGKPFQHVSRSWDCWQVKNEPEERCDGLAHG